MSETVELQIPVIWQRLGKALKVKGIALTSGTFRGRDGKAIYYPPEVIEQSHKSLVGKPIWYRHASNNNQERLPVGFISGSGEGFKTAFYEGYVYQPEMIRKIEETPNYPVSMEAMVWGEPTKEGMFKANAIEFKGLAFTEHPACKEASNLAVEPVALEVQQTMSEEIKEQLSEVYQELSTVKEELARQREEQKIEILQEIKEYNPSFDEKVFLEGQEDINQQIVILKAYLSGIRQKKQEMVKASESKQAIQPEMVPKEKVKSKVELANEFCQQALGMTYEELMKKGVMGEMQEQEMYPLEGE